VNATDAAGAVLGAAVLVLVLVVPPPPQAVNASAHTHARTIGKQKRVVRSVIFKFSTNQTLHATAQRKFSTPGFYF
jgi:hypothetical protein